MSKRQRDALGQATPGPPPDRRPADPLAMLTLVGVVALLGISLASWRDVARMEASLDQRMRELEARIDDSAEGTRRLPARARRGPDPNRVYPVRTEGAPVRGKAGAPIVIAEFSDYQ